MLTSTHGVESLSYFSNCCHVILSALEGGAMLNLNNLRKWFGGASFVFNLSHPLLSLLVRDKNGGVRGWEWAYYMSIYYYYKAFSASKQPTHSLSQLSLSIMKSHSSFARLVVVSYCFLHAENAFFGSWVMQNSSGYSLILTSAQQPRIRGCSQSRGQILMCHIVCWTSVTYFRITTVNFVKSMAGLRATRCNIRQWIVDDLLFCKLRRYFKDFFLIITLYILVVL